PASKLETYRQAERDICEYFAVPYSEIYKTCKICPLTSPALMPDALHPNDFGHGEIARVLRAVVEGIL
ncbi:SGNH/GDSL hydrolase family protein, partial [Viscerimonas tarda]